MVKELHLTIKANKDGIDAIYDAINETLRALAYSGDINDKNDDGWEWTE